MFSKKTYPKIYERISNSHQSSATKSNFISQSGIAPKFPSNSSVDIIDQNKETKPNSSYGNKNVEISSTIQSELANEKSKNSTKQNRFRLGKEAFKETPTIQRAKLKEREKSTQLQTAPDPTYSNKVTREKSSCDKKMSNNIQFEPMNLKSITSIRQNKFNLNKESLKETPAIQLVQKKEENSTQLETTSKSYEPSNFQIPSLHNQDGTKIIAMEKNSNSPLTTCIAQDMEKIEPVGFNQASLACQASEDEASKLPLTSTENTSTLINECKKEDDSRSLNAERKNDDKRSNCEDVTPSNYLINDKKPSVLPSLLELDCKLPPVVKNENTSVENQNTPTVRHGEHIEVSNDSLHSKDSSANAKDKVDKGNKNFTPTLRTSVKFGLQTKNGINMGSLSTGPLNIPYGYDKRMPNTYYRPPPPPNFLGPNINRPGYHPTSRSFNIQGQAFNNPTSYSSIEQGYASVQPHATPLNPEIYAEQSNAALTTKQNVPKFDGGIRQLQPPNTVIPQEQILNNYPSSSIGKGYTSVQQQAPPLNSVIYGEQSNVALGAEQSIPNCDGGIQQLHTQNTAMHQVQRFNNPSTYSQIGQRYASGQSQAPPVNHMKCAEQSGTALGGKHTMPTYDGGTQQMQLQNTVLSQGHRFNNPLSYSPIGHGYTSVHSQALPSNSVNHSVRTNVPLGEKQIMSKYEGGVQKLHPQNTIMFQGQRLNNPPCYSPWEQGNITVQSQASPLNPVRYTEQGDATLGTNQNIPTYNAESKELLPHNIVMPPFNQHEGTKRRPDGSNEQINATPSKKLANHVNGTNVNTAISYTPSQPEPWVGNSNYGFQDQRNGDTSMLVQMYAPSAATGWYAQQPQIDEKEWVQEYTTSNVHTLDPTSQGPPYDWYDYSKQYSQHCHNLNSSEQQNHSTPLKAGDSQLPQPPHPPPSGADSESWKAYYNLMAKYWSHWSSQAEQTSLGTNQNRNFNSDVDDSQIQQPLLPPKLPSLPN